MPCHCDVTRGVTMLVSRCVRREGGRSQAKWCQLFNRHHPGRLPTMDRLESLGSTISNITLYDIKSMYNQVRFILPKTTHVGLGVLCSCIWMRNHYRQRM